MKLVVCEFVKTEQAST